MPNQQLIDYIKQSRVAGKSDADIKSALLGAGWQEADRWRIWNIEFKSHKKE